MGELKRFESSNPVSAVMLGNQTAAITPPAQSR
jgi:hypothetical protein